MIEPLTQPLAVLVSPLLMPRQGLIPLSRRLRRGGIPTRLFGYPSYRKDIPANADRLAQFLRELGDEPFDVVAHSLGGIVLRWAVNHCGARVPRRVVMIATPNQGARLAATGDRLMGPLFPLVWGRCVRQLRPGADGLCEIAGPLPAECEVGIIAGGTGTTRGVNPFLRGDNDRIVRVEETKLAGMKDFILLPMAHGPLIFRRGGADQVVAFLRNGAFDRDV